jgi:ATPase related to the helicase subunit of the Holliday junction resolvase
MPHRNKAIILQIDDMYRLNSSKQIIGNEDAVAAIRSFVRSFWSGGSKKPLIVYGPTGTGKSTAVRLIAKEESMNLIELNASDYRDSKKLATRVLPALGTRPIFGNGSFILFDEIDELSGRHDKGASSTILSMIKEPRAPVVFIANDMWDQRITFLRNKTIPTGFKKPSQSAISELLSRISKETGIMVSDRTIAWIAKMCDGDVRSGINDLYVMSGAPEDDVEVIGVRDKKSDIFTTLDRIFLSHTIGAPMRAVMYSDVDNSMLTNWIDENIPNRYVDNPSISKAYEMLAASTIYSSRASRSGYYTYWRYMNALMSAGVSISKERGCSTSKRYSFPKVVKDLSGNKADRTALYAIADKLKGRIHSNSRYIISDYIPVLSKIIRKATDAGIEKDEVYRFFERHFELSDKEVDAVASTSRHAF